jgi:hypothetical protein
LKNDPTGTRRPLTPVPVLLSAPAGSGRSREAAAFDARPSSAKPPILDHALNYVLMYLLIGFSGMSFFMENKVLLTVALVISATLFFHQINRIDNEFIDIMALLGALSVLQGFLFRSFDVESILATLMYYSFAYFMVRTIGDRFPAIYVNTVYALTLVSFVFWPLSLISSDFLSLISGIPRILHLDPHHHENFLVYTVQKYYATSFHILRNSGPVYEAGMFATILILALIFNTIQERALVNRKNGVLIAAVLTTFSTAGYLALFCFLISYFICERDLFKKTFWIPLLLFLSVYSYYNVSFLSRKVERDVKFANYGSGRQSGQYSNLGRIGSALVDLQIIRKHPLTGTGRSPRNRFGKVVRNKNGLLSSHRTNGVFDFIAENGIPFSILYFFLMYRSFYRFCALRGFNRHFALYSLLLILLVGSSQTIFMRPLFLGLIFVRLAVPFRQAPAGAEPVRV